MVTTKSVQVDLRFLGSDRVIERPKGVFKGGVPAPIAIETLGFNVLREDVSEEEIIAARGHPPYDGTLQVNLWGDTAAFRELGRYLLAVAELDTSADPNFHQHHDLTSSDGRTQVQLIVRKQLS
jgi:hypothetical protein